MKTKVFILVLALLFLVIFIGCERSSGGIEPDLEQTSVKDTEQNIPETLPENPVSDFEYNVREQGDIIITKYIGTEKNVIVPAMIEGMPVKYIGESAFKESDIETVVLPDTIESVGIAAFSHCENLRQIDLGAGITIIQWLAFVNCDSLTSIDLSADTMQIIQFRAFSSCENLTEVFFGDNIKQMIGNLTETAYRKNQ